jgi:hemerythrin-like domain-containing protein
VNIDKFKSQHVEILTCIATLRKLSHAGVAGNAAEIAQLIISMSSIIKLHLAIEDRSLYPALARSGDGHMVNKGRQFQVEMGTIAQAYEKFALHWNTAKALQEEEEAFKADANIVLRKLHERIQRENVDLYPKVEAL